MGEQLFWCFSHQLKSRHSLQLSPNCPRRNHYPRLDCGHESHTALASCSHHRSQLWEEKKHRCLVCFKSFNTLWQFQQLIWHKQQQQLNLSFMFVRQAPCQTPTHLEVWHFWSSKQNFPGSLIPCKHSPYILSLRPQNPSTLKCQLFASFHDLQGARSYVYWPS